MTKHYGKIWATAPLALHHQTGPVFVSWDSETCNDYSTTGHPECCQSQISK